MWYNLSYEKDQSGQNEEDKEGQKIKVRCENLSWVSNFQIPWM